MLNIEKIDKKYRYIINSFLITIYIYLASVVFWNSSFYLRMGFGFLIILFSSYFVHYPNVGFKNLRDSFFTLILPVYLLGSILMALKYYPNLSISFKIFMLLVSATVFYIISLVDNIFLVIRDREETIPLYRAAVPWSQILLVVVAIPLFAGVFKIPLYSFYQAMILGLLSGILNIYQFWSYRHEENLIPVRVGGSVLFSAFCAFLVFGLAIATSFMPAKAFLRGLICTAGLMFGLFYTSSFLRNSINKKLIIEYFSVILVFIALGLLFQ
jgi:hypothetical protein